MLSAVAKTVSGERTILYVLSDYELFELVLYVIFSHWYSINLYA